MFVTDNEINFVSPSMVTLSLNRYELFAERKLENAVLYVPVWSVKIPSGTETEFAESVTESPDGSNGSVPRPGVETVYNEAFATPVMANDKQIAAPIFKTLFIQIPQAL